MRKPLCSVCNDAARTSFCQEVREGLRKRGLYAPMHESDLIGAIFQAINVDLVDEAKGLGKNMDPNEISKLISEDVRVNNGLVCEEQKVEKIMVGDEVGVLTTDEYLDNGRKCYTQVLRIGDSGIRMDGEVGAGRSHHEHEYFGPRAEEFLDRELIAYLPEVSDDV